MVLGSYLSTKKVCESTPEQRDELVKDAFGFTQEELNDLRAPRDREDHLYTVALAIYEKTKDPISVTQNNIAAVGSLEWEGEKTSRKYGKKLWDTYKLERSMSKARGVKVTSTHILRKKIDAYFGNLEETAPLWEVNPSPEDWLRSVKLPESLELDYNTSFLLGVIWADGRPRIRSGSTGIQLVGSHDDVHFYGNTLVPMMNEIFNYNVSFLIEDKKSATTMIKKEEVIFGESKSPRLELGSQAVTNFIHSLGFPKEERRDVELPYFDKEGFSYNKKAFFDGIVAGMGNKQIKYEKTGSFNIRIFDNDSVFIENLHELAKELNYNPSSIYHFKKQKRSRFVIFSEDSKKITLINPKHLLKI